MPRAREEQGFCFPGYPRYERKFALCAGEDLRGIPRARKMLGSSCLPERISLKPKESGRRGKCLWSVGLRLCQAQSSAGRSRTEAMCCEGRSWYSFGSNVLTEDQL